MKYRKKKKTKRKSQQVIKKGGARVPINAHVPRRYTLHSPTNNYRPVNEQYGPGRNYTRKHLIPTHFFATRSGKAGGRHCNLNASRMHAADIEGATRLVSTPPPP